MRNCQLSIGWDTVYIQLPAQLTRKLNQISLKHYWRVKMRLSNHIRTHP